MEATPGTSTALVDRSDALAEVLSRTGAWDWFALLRLIEVWDGGVGIGGVGPAAREPVRSRGHLALSFPPRDIAWARVVRTEAGRARAEISVAFMGLYGVDSPLPLHVTEALLQTEDEEARARVQDFLDLFNHLVLSLLYRAWGRYRLHVQAGRASAGRASAERASADTLRRHIAALIDLPEVPARSGISPAFLYKAAGLLYQRPRSTSGLETLLRLLLPDVPIHVLSCVPREVLLARRERARLGRRRSRLGRDLVLGERVWDTTARLRVRVGPIATDTLESYQLGGERFAQIQGAVSLWCEGQLPWDLEIRLSSLELKPTVLSAENPSGRLGVDSWLGQPPQDLTSVILEPPA